MGWLAVAAVTEWGTLDYLMGTRLVWAGLEVALVLALHGLEVIGK